MSPPILILIITILTLLNHISLFAIIVSALAFVPVFVFITFTIYIDHFDTDHSYGGLLLAVLAFVIIAASLFVNYKWQSVFVSVFFIVILFFLFTLLFPSPIVEVGRDPYNRTYGCDTYTTAPLYPWSAPTSRPLRIFGRTTGPTGVKNNIDNSTVGLIKSEHQTATSEIAARSTINDDWFHNKFILVGGLLAALLIHLKGLGSEKTGTTASAVSDLENLFKKTIIPASVLGMACVLSLAIDIHIANNQMIVQQLAHWIKNCVEVFLNKDTEYYMGWESFIRIKDNHAQGMHMDYIFNLFNASHFYLASILLYVVYVTCLFVCFSESKKKNEYIASLFVFFVVHITLAMFVLEGNSFPSTFTVQLAVWPDRPFSGQKGGIIPFFICLLISYLTFMRLFTLYDSKKQSGKEQIVRIDDPGFRP